MLETERSKDFTIKGFQVKDKTGRRKSLTIPVIPTRETLDANHTQFVFLRDYQEGNEDFECRKAFENFLLNICSVNSGMCL